MIEEILLLCDPLLEAELTDVLHAANPDLTVSVIHNRADLAARCAVALHKTRLVSFGSDVIVPAAVLEALDCGAYNFHPGPPSYPGRFPSTFFIEDGGRLFGSTVHEMAAQVDSGPINAVDRFEVPADLHCVDLNLLSFHSLLALFKKLAPHLAVDEAPLARTDAVWSGRTTTQRDFDALCRLPSDVDAEAFQRRLRAVGEGPDHALEITLHGHRFRLDNGHTAPDVLVGGKKR